MGSVFWGWGGELNTKIFALGEWYSCKGLTVVANSRVLTLGFNCLNGLVPRLLKLPGSFE